MRMDMVPELHHSLLQLDPDGLAAETLIERSQ